MKRLTRCRVCVYADLPQGECLLNPPDNSRPANIWHYLRTDRGCYQGEPKPDIYKNCVNHCKHRQPAYDLSPKKPEEHLRPQQGEATICDRLGCLVLDPEAFVDCEQWEREE